ncbi:MAG: c-type cytochrome [Rhodothermales bacterium]|nr:c-type cytochrome [Rhodothermales bacterium]
MRLQFIYPTLRTTHSVARFLGAFVLAVCLLSVSDGFAQSEVAAARGEAVYDQVCSTCHSVAKPADMSTRPIAPPLQMISMHYFNNLDSDDAVRTAMTEWLIKPDSARSQLPAKAIEHHGLMPEQALSEEDRAAVVEFVMSLNAGDTCNMMGGDMSGMKGGMKEGMGNGRMKEGMKGGMKEGMGNGRMNHGADSTSSAGHECSMMQGK